MKRWIFVAVLGLLFANVASADDFLITDFGAIGDGATLNTPAIQQAIERAAAAEGRVVVPKGVFKTGAVFLKLGAALHLDRGAVLLGSTDLADYPSRRTRIEGHFENWRPALVNASGMTEVRITGAGTLDGNGRPFWNSFWKRRAENPACTNLEVERPRLLFLDDCSDVVVRDVHLKDSGFWNLHLYKCRHVTIDGITITAPHGDPPQITDVTQPWDEVSVGRATSSDGIDVDSCQDVTIRKCTISVGDDCIALKGSKGPLALEDDSSPPVENILIEDCDFQNGHGVLTCGSEATIVRNVRVRNARVGAGIPVVRLKLRPDTPQLYENLEFDTLTLDDAQAIFDVKPWTQFFDLAGHEPPQSVVRNVVVRNVSGSVESLGELRGNRGDAIEDILLENIDLTARRPQLRTDFAQAIKLENVEINGQPFTLK
jgi:alpha-L-rhamnosidase